MSNKYTITSGNYKKNNFAFFNLWIYNTLENSNPQSIEIINTGGDEYVTDYKCNWHNYTHNYGHVQNLKENTPFGGWWLAFMHGALCAYMNDTDFIYKEEDCFCFGNWVDSLYNDIEEKQCKMLVGFFDHNYKIEQSLVFIQRDYILKFINMYLSLCGNEGYLYNRPELKFLSLKEYNKQDIQYMSMRGGRNRPIPIGDKSFYVQHLTRDEFILLSDSGYFKGVNFE